MSAMLRAFILLEVGFACFVITDVFLVDTGNQMEDSTINGLRYDGDVYNPPAVGCNKIPCGLGTNNVPASTRVAIDLQSGMKLGLHLRIENASFAGKYGFEMRYGDNPQFALGTSGFVLGSPVTVTKNSDQLSRQEILTLSPSFTANATIEVYFTVDEAGFGGRNTTTYYQCVDLTVKGSAPLPSWAPDFGPKEQSNYNVDPGGTRGYDCALDPRCQSYMPKLSDWDWLIILCVLSFLVLCVCICIICMCFRKNNTSKAVVSPPPEPPPPQDEGPKEITPSVSKASPYAHMVFTDPNDPPSKKSTDSGSTGERGTGSQGRHFHFHYEEAEPEGTTTDKPEVVVRP